MAVKLVNQLIESSPLLSVGILSGNLMNLENDVSMLEQAGAEVLHFDVMDGCFCPAITAGPFFVKGLKTSMLKDVHLMVNNPQDKVETFVKAGADIITFNIEGCTHIHQTLQMLGQMENANEPGRGLVKGVSLNPGTPLDVIEPLIEHIDIVLLLAVNPGFSGQKLITSVAGRAAAVRALAKCYGKEILLCIDGGVKKENVGQVAKFGADIIVTGSAVFAGDHPSENFKSMRRIAKDNYTKGGSE